jgi:hypothetical protein
MVYENDEQDEKELAQILYWIQHSHGVCGLPSYLSALFGSVSCLLAF